MRVASRAKPHESNLQQEDNQPITNQLITFSLLSSQYALHYFSGYVGQAEWTALEVVGQFGVIETHLV